MTKQYVWLVRYGKTEFPLVEYDGPFNSDIDPTEGMEHAQSIGQQIASSPSDTLPAKVYCSPFLRTTHTASVVGKALSEMNKNIHVHVEEGLYEWLAPSLLIDRDGVRTYPQNASELKCRFGNIDETYESRREIEEKDFPEDIRSLIHRCQAALDGILDHAEGENLAIVTHAPCVQALAFAMEMNMDSDQDAKDVMEMTGDSKLGKLPLGGVTRFSRDVVKEESMATATATATSFGKWQMDFYGSTEHMPGDYRNGLGLWSLPCFDK